MDINNIQDPNQAKDHADNLQGQINDLKGQAKTASGDEKQGILSKIEDLKNEKDAVMAKFNELKNLKKDAEGFLGKL